MAFEVTSTTTTVIPGWLVSATALVLLALVGATVYGILRLRSRRGGR